MCVSRSNVWRCRESNLESNVGGGNMGKLNFDSKAGGGILFWWGNTFGNLLLVLEPFVKLDLKYLNAETQLEVSCRRSGMSEKWDV